MPERLIQELRLFVEQHNQDTVKLGELNLYCYYNQIANELKKLNEENKYLRNQIKEKSVIIDSLMIVGGCCRYEQ